MKIKMLALKLTSFKTQRFAISCKGLRYIKPKIERNIMK